MNPYISFYRLQPSLGNTDKCSETRRRNPRVSRQSCRYHQDCAGAARLARHTQEGREASLDQESMHPMSPRFVVVLIALLLLMALAPSFAEIYTEWLWFGETGYQSVFLTSLVTKGVLGLGVFLIAFGVLFANLRLAVDGSRRRRPRPDRKAWTHWQSRRRDTTRDPFKPSAGATGRHTATKSRSSATYLSSYNARTVATELISLDIAPGGDTCPARP